MRRLTSVLFILFSLIAAGCILIFSLRIHEEIKGAREYADICRIAMTAGEKKDSPDETALKEINPEYAAWLYIPGTAVNYPVVFPQDNQTYLEKTFAGSRNSCGALFFDCPSVPFISLNTVIHGHNMRSGAMFGGLKEYLSGEYAGAHRTLCLFHQGRWEKYELLSVYLTPDTDTAPYRYMFASAEDYKIYVEQCCERDMSALQAVPVDKTQGKRPALLTLTTCHGPSQKLILHFAGPMSGSL